MTYTYLPFMILPLYSNLAKMDLRLLEAAADLGASAGPRSGRVTVPLSRAGIIAGAMLVFIPCVGEYVIPELLGGPQTQMIGRTLWDEFFSNNDWPMACAVAVTMMLLVIVPLACSAATRARPRSARRLKRAARLQSRVRARLARRSATRSSTCRSSRSSSTRSTFAGRQRLARLHAAVVCRARRRPRAARRPGAVAEGRVLDRLRVGRPRHARGVRAGRAIAASSAARCSPAWSRRRWSCPR